MDRGRELALVPYRRQELAAMVNFLRNERYPRAAIIAGLTNYAIERYGRRAADYVVNQGNWLADQLVDYAVGAVRSGFQAAKRRAGEMFGGGGGGGHLKRRMVYADDGHPKTKYGIRDFASKVGRYGPYRNNRMYRKKGKKGKPRMRYIQQRK